MSKLDKLPVKQEIIHKLAIGEPQTSIPRQVGVNLKCLRNLSMINCNEFVVILTK